MWEFLNRCAGGMQEGGSSLSCVPVGVCLSKFQACFPHFDLFVAHVKKIIHQLPQIVFFSVFFIVAVFSSFDLSSSRLGCVVSFIIIFFSQLLIFMLQCNSVVTL